MEFLEEFEDRQRLRKRRAGYAGLAIDQRRDRAENRPLELTANKPMADTRLPLDGHGPAKCVGFR
jgi:hypothetical protein